MPVIKLGYIPGVRHVKDDESKRKTEDEGPKRDGAIFFFHNNGAGSDFSSFQCPNLDSDR